ncbi:MAG: hypothetical protein ACFB22_05385, partial [Rhodothalassiaceae bacterium]
MAADKTGGGGGAEEPRRPAIDSEEALEAWLRDKPTDWSVAIAARAALRVLPLTAAPRNLDLTRAALRALVFAAGYPGQSSAAKTKIAGAVYAAANAAVAADAARAGAYGDAAVYAAARAAAAA